MNERDSSFSDMEKRSHDGEYSPPLNPAAPEEKYYIQENSKYWKYVPFQHMSLKPKLRNPVITTAVACMGGLLFGFGSTNLSALIGGEEYERYYAPNGKQGESFSSIQQSGLTGAMPGGAMLGAIISAFIAAPIGRRGMVEFAALIWTIGCAIQTASNNRVALAWGRIIASIGVGCSSANVPPYLAEMVPAKTRGRYLACFQFSVNLGMLIMYYISFGCSFIHSKSSFRLSFGLQMIPGGIMLIGSMFLHESPAWLASKGRFEECTEVLCSINKANPDDPVVQNEVAVLKKDLTVKPGKFKEMFNKRNRMQTFCATFTMFSQQFVGCNAILYFSTSITSQIGYTGTMNKIMGSIDYCVLVFATFFSVLLFDYFKRRPTMIIGGFGLLTCMAIVAGLEATHGYAVDSVNGDPSVRWNIPTDDAPTGKAALAFSYIYLGFFSLSWGPVAWVYVGEIFNMEVRAYGNAWASFINWLFNFVLTIFTESAFENIKWKTYVIFAVFCFLIIPVVFFTFPETTGYELDEISEIFASGIPAWKTDIMYVWVMKHILHKDPTLNLTTKKTTNKDAEIQQPIGQSAPTTTAHANDSVSELSVH